MPTMRSMLNRIRRLEAARVPEERERAAVEAIRDTSLRQRERYGPDYKDPYADLPPLPPARNLAEAIIQMSKQIMEYQRAEREAKRSQGTPE